ncbi:MAG: SO_0444 family Cu/Zn efflux transporter, partial [Deltaproteobacteria bacterium]
QEASIYVLFGILVAGMLRIFLSPGTVAHHLGRGKFRSVFKASLLGIPIPLCSCGVLPAAASLKKQGANNGATTAFLISTPESGVDSVALTYALLDPVMTVARPAAAFATATAAGLSENLLSEGDEDKRVVPDLSCTVDGCCDGWDCLPAEHRSHHTFSEKIKAGLTYALNDLWNDIAVWFLVGIFLAGLITALIPADMMTRYLGGGLSAMLIMLAAGIPLYICATASTPIAAALILKGASPGAALVFLLVGPATNITSLTVLLGILGKRATAIYLAAIALSAVVFGLALDQVYSILGMSAQAMAGQAAEVIPHWAQVGGAMLLLGLSIRPVYHTLRSKLMRGEEAIQGATCDCPTESSLHLADINLKDPSCTSST